VRGEKDAVLVETAKSEADILSAVVEVPDLVLKKLPQAHSMLADAGLKLGDRI
jgi:hypothetical protein